MGRRTGRRGAAETARATLEVGAQPGIAGWDTHLKKLEKLSAPSAQIHHDFLNAQAIKIA